MKTRYKIEFRGLKEGTHEWEWLVGNDFWADKKESGIIGGEIKVRATLNVGPESGRNSGTTAAGALRVEAEMEGHVVVPCDRCLEDCRLPVRYEGRFVVSEKAVAGEVGEDFDGEVMWLAPGEREIDLEQYIYESVVLSLPLQRVHPEDVHGQPLCNPAMLERFKIVTEEEFENLNNTLEQNI